MANNNSGAGVATFSLYDQLAAVPSQGYVATDLIKYLIQVISYDTCAFKRNTQTTYRLVNRACQIYTGINDLVQKVDTEKGDTWDDYDKYTRAIDPLEDILFRVSALIEKESLTKNWLISNDSIGVCLASITEWADNRNKLRAFVTDLQTQISDFPPLSNDDASLAQKHDDSNLLYILCVSIHTHTLQDAVTTRYRSGRKQGGCIADTKNHAKTISSQIPNAFSNDLLTELSIKCIMLVYGVMQVSTAIPDEEEKARLMSWKTWEKATTLLSRLSAHLKDTSSPTFENLLENWKEFVAYLQTITSWELPEEFYDIRKKAKDVGRAYHSQTLQLLQQCKVLADYFKKHTTAINHASLTTAIAAATPAVDSAARATNDMKLMISEEKSELRAEVQKAFSDAQTTFEDCFKKCEMSDKWTEFAKGMEKALKADQERVAQLTEKMKKRDGQSYRHSKSVTFKLKKVAPGGTSSEDLRTCTAEENTTLSAILWNESILDSRFLNGWHFEHTKGTAREVIGFDKEVKEIQAEKGQLTLYIVSN